MKGLIWALTVFLFTFKASEVKAQRNPVYVDKGGVLRWTATKKEAAFFGVNYTVPFAHGYRSHKALGIDPERAIDTDVAHMARLRLNAFRVHVWDTEITDSAGNLLQNEHLRLFDYLLMRLKEKGIKILITPLAFWGNGYPEPDEKTGSFSSKYNKRQVLVTPEAIAAQENYLRQFFRHFNPYTKSTYGNDPDVIAMEINNEPHHSGPKEGVTDYINRMVSAVRSTGWTKPVFYNISESPAYADAVVQAKVDGHSFQWYPTGLVANRTLEGNYLPHVDQYRIPFLDTIPAFAKRARMVYEFDAGDVLQAYMYPAMARSFRAAGFQWATQFAYDPLFTAHTNTEYQTHYLNLAYTPSKAISLLIAGEVFRTQPRGGSMPVYPDDTVFSAFRLSHSANLSELNRTDAFYYTNTTHSQPVQPTALTHVAGVGSSPLVQYGGTGAYFLDRSSPGCWKLEVLPDVFELADPFGPARPHRAVRRLLSLSRSMTVQLPDLGPEFRLISGADTLVASGHTVTVRPGRYLLLRAGTSVVKTLDPGIAWPATTPAADSVLCTHEPEAMATAGKGLRLVASFAGAVGVEAELRHSNGTWRRVALKPETGFTWAASLPAASDTIGRIQYRFLATDQKGQIHSFPGGHRGDPYRWDAPATQTWETLLLPERAQLVLFDAADDPAQTPYVLDWRQQKIGLHVDTAAPFIWQHLATSISSNTPLLGWQQYIGNKLEAQVETFSRLKVRARTKDSVTLHLVLIDKAGAGHTASVSLYAGTSDWTVPFTALKPAPYLLLPRPYPGFQPLLFNGGATNNFSPSALEKLQVYLSNATGPVDVYVQKIWME